MGKSRAQKQAEQNDLAIQRLQIQAQQQALELRQRQAALVEPFARGTLGIGEAALRGDISNPALQALMAPGAAQIGAGFQGARESLVDFFGRSGQGLGSGLATGPIANTFTQEAAARANLAQQTLGQGLQLGFSGANVGQGLIGQFNPAQQALPLNPQQFGGGFFQNLGGALAGGFGIGAKLPIPGGGALALGI